MAANIRRCAEIVRERAVLRRLVTAGDEIATSALNPAGRQTKQILDEAESRVFRIAEEGARGRQGFIEIQPLLTKVVERIQETVRARQPVGCDRCADRLRRHGCGRPRPAAWGSRHRRRAAVNRRGRFRTECRRARRDRSGHAGGGVQWRWAHRSSRCACFRRWVDWTSNAYGQVASTKMATYTTAIQKMHEAPLYIDETPALTAIDLRARARRLARTCGKLQLHMHHRLPAADERERTR